MTGGGADAADLSPLEAASGDDAAWFKARPHRRHRVRPYVPGELPGEPVPDARPGRRWYTAVCQIVPGVRMRRVFAIEGEPGVGEHAAARWFAIAMSGEVP